MAQLDVSTDIAALDTVISGLTTKLTALGGVAPQPAQTTELIALSGQVAAFANTIQKGVPPVDPRDPPSYYP